MWKIITISGVVLGKYNTLLEAIQYGCRYYRDYEWEIVGYDGERWKK